MIFHLAGYWKNTRINDGKFSRINSHRTVEPLNKHLVNAAYHEKNK